MRPASLNRSTWLPAPKWTIAYIIELGLAEELGLLEDVVDQHLLGCLLLVEVLRVLLVGELLVLEVFGLREDE